MDMTFMFSGSPVEILKREFFFLEVTGIMEVFKSFIISLQSGIR